MGLITPKFRRIGMIVGATIALILWGILFLCHIPRSWAWAFLFGAFAALVTVLLLVLYHVEQAKRYAEAQSRVGNQVVLFARISLGDGKIIRKGYIFLTPHHLHFYLWVSRPFLEAHFTRADLRAQITPEYAATMKLYPAGDKEGFLFFSNDMEKIVDIMKVHGYVVDVVDKGTFLGAPQATESLPKE